MINKIVSPAFGYLIVAFVCGLAGYSSNPDRVAINPGELVLLVLLLGFLLPVYINRAILYEQKKHNTERDGDYLPETHVIWGMSIGLPAFIFLLASILCLLVLVGTELNLSGGETDVPKILLKIFIALLPAYAFGFWNNHGWQKDERVYFFRYRSFFPALATCILPFIYGWSGPDELFSITAASFLLLMAWGVSLRLGVFKLSLFLLVLFSILIIASVVTRVHSFDIPNVMVSFIQVFSFGVLMTLVMGVSESWRVSTRIRDDVEYGPPGVYDQSDTNLYLSGTNLAASLFLPFFLVTFLHPSTTSLYLAGVLVLLCLQFILWFVFSSKWTHAIWSVLGLSFGLALPFLISIGTNFNVKAPFAHEALNIPSFFDVGGPITIFIGYASYLGGWAKIPLLRNLFPVPNINVRYFLGLRPCLALTGLSASVVLIIISFVPPILEITQGLGSVGDFFLARTRLLQVIYLVIIIVCAFTLFVKTNGSDDADAKTKKEPSNALEMESKTSAINFVADSLKSLIISGRPTTAFLVGIVAWLIIVLNSSYHPILAALRVVPIVLVTMVGFILNDIFDLEKDRFSGKDRPIVAGRLSISLAKKGMVCLCCLAMLWEGVFFSINSFLIVFVALLGVFLYSPFSHKAPLVKGLWTAILTCTPMFYAESVSQIEIPLYLYGLLIVFVIGRELLMDVKDYEGDRRYGLRTIPYYVGLNRSTKIASVLMIASVLFICFSDISMTARLFAGCSLLALLYAVNVFSRNMEKSFIISRLSLLFISISAALSI
jgi:4-hydroxybenzoate polyprenyltransferase